MHWIFVFKNPTWFEEVISQIQTGLWIILEGVPRLSPPDAKSITCDPKCISEPDQASLREVNLQCQEGIKISFKMVKLWCQITMLNIFVQVLCFVIIVTVSKFYSWFEIFNVFKRTWHVRFMFLSEILRNIWLI